MRWVLDASIALSFVLADEYAAASAQVLRDVAEDGALVPTLWDYEVLNGLRSAEKRGRITDAGIRHALAGLNGLAIERDRRPVDGMRVISLARQFDLSGYDATYLWLAIEANGPLATIDSTLQRAAAAAGVAVLASD